MPSMSVRLATVWKWPEGQRMPAFFPCNVALISSFSWCCSQLASSAMVAPLEKWIKPVAKSSTPKSVRSHSPQPPGMSKPLAKLVCARSGDAHGSREIHQPKRRVERVHADVHARAAAAEVRVDEAGAGRQPVAARGVDAGVIDLAEGARLDPRLDRDGIFLEAEMLGGHQDAIGFAQRVAHGEDFLGRDGQRLFAEDVLAGLERGAMTAGVWTLFGVQMSTASISFILSISRKSVKTVGISKSAASFAGGGLMDVAGGDDLGIRHRSQPGLRCAPRTMPPVPIRPIFNLSLITS